MYNPFYEKKIFRVFFLLLSITMPLTLQQGDVEFLSKSQVKFTMDLYQILAKSQPGNIFFSPFSVMTAMSMVHMGAEGNTEKQSQAVLHLPSNKEVIKNEFSKMLSSMKVKSDNYELQTSNSAYISNKLTVLHNYTAALKSFDSEAKSVDFDSPETVRNEINRKVEVDTRQKIKDLIPAGAINSLTRMVLVNAIYFKGLWQHQFDVSKTKIQPFWIDSTNSVDVPMMAIEEKFKWSKREDLESSILAMDYKGGRVTMVIILPDRRDGLAQLESKLSSVDLGSLDKELRSIKIQVTIPKFKLEQSVELSDSFKKMGMTDVFDKSTSNLSGISAETDLFISNIFHKSFLEVNEEGSEAAAATGAVITTFAFVRRPPPFVADHPFFFYIKDLESEQILFSGRLTEPNA